MARGRVQRWDGQTGRILDAADGASVFFGDRGLRGLTPLEVQPGLEVEFDRDAGDRGPRARNVRRAGGGTPAAGTEGPAGQRRDAAPPRQGSGSLPGPPAEVP